MTNPPDARLVRRLRWFDAFTGTGARAQWAWKAVPVLLFVLALIGISTSRALLTENHVIWIEVAALSVLSGLSLIAFIAWNARLLNQADRAWTETRTLNAELEQRVAQRTEALGESEGRLAGVIHSAMDSILTVDDRQIIVLFNAAAEKVFRCSAAEALGQPLSRFIPRRFHALHAEHVRKFGETGVTNRAMGPQAVLWAVRADGDEFQIEASISQVVTRGKRLFTVILRDVTERQRLEQVRERLASVVESSDDAIIAKTLDGTITDWNRGAEKLFGYTTAEAIGKRMSMFIPPERTREETDILTRIGRGESIQHFETVRVRKNGARVDVSVTISPIKDNRGVVVGASKVARDITESKRTEARLREQSQLLDLAQVLVRDMENRIVLWTHGAEKLYGFSPQEALGHVSHDLLQTKFPESAEEIERKFFANGSWEGELTHRKHDGSIVVVTSTWVLQRDAQGRPLKILEVNSDLTASKRLEERLTRQAEELLRSREALEAQTTMLQSVLDSIDEGLVAVNERGEFTIWNPAAERIVGQGAADVPPPQWSEHYRVYMPDMVTPFPPEMNPLARALRGETSTAEMFIQNPELERGAWIEATAGPLKGKNGVLSGGVVAFRDITRNKNAEREIWKLNEELERRVLQRTEQLEAANQELEAFTYSVSHDLRAPLRHMSGFSKLLVEEFGPTLDPEAQHYLHRIQEGTGKMGQLVDELLNLARVGRHAVSLQVTGLDSILEEVVTMLKPEYQDREVEWQIGTLPFVECDPTLTKQVFQNLLSNALKFTRPRATARIEVRQIDHNGTPTILVRDNGVGFSMKYADKLFGVFQRLHRSEDFEGTGVGLATVQRIIQKHGGCIWAEAELEKGAAFYFTLGPGVTEHIDMIHGKTAAEAVTQ